MQSVFFKRKISVFFTVPAFGRVRYMLFALQKVLRVQRQNYQPHRNASTIKISLYNFLYCMPNSLFCKLKFVKQVSKTFFTLLCKCVICLKPEDTTSGSYLHINNNCNFIYINVVNSN
uniref:Uncharacterized protein n=1 Tax=Anticarsia gemmatalis multiple nucleopolyhedrovirus TaxID=268591 RepID=A0A0S3J0X3_9ABAC|nr:hypothetical protein AGNV_091 [Anticarsia gemmatalis multiple nucleopolyhedrovirus]